VRELALEECRRQGAYFLSPEEMEKVGRLLILPGTHTPNTKIVGRPATMIAEMAGITVRPATRVLIARLGPEQVGREFPLSAEKLSPILAFYAAPNLAAGIALCRRLLEFGGLGHTCSIHSQNRAAILEFGAAMPAFRVVVNSAAVHGSIGYSTNLFPAMTLGCGAPGGNITSDNIGPQHLMNIKRIAWESRGIEHRTVPADQRMAGASPLAAPEAVQAKSSVAPVGQAVFTPTEVKGLPVPPVEAAGSGVFATSAEGGQTRVSVLPDRTAIARVVEHVMASHGIARGSGATKSAPTAKELPSPSAVAAEIAGRLFGIPAKQKSLAGDSDSTGLSNAARNLSRLGREGGTPDSSTHPPESGRDTTPLPKSETPPKPAVEISPFVSENDVRRAMTRSEKIFIGPKTILTPSARDLGMEHEVFIETEAGSLR